jgi:uracil-DNA glycosylase
MPRTTAALRPAGRYPLPPLPAAWKTLEPETRTPTFRALAAFLRDEARVHAIYPPAREVFRALELTPLRRVRVLLLGQDPYPGAGQAHGLCFSVRPGVKPPASLRNIFRELEADVGIAPPAHGSLERWATQGVLLLNAALTVRAGEPNSHRDRGWEPFTDEIIRRVARKRKPVAFALWGAFAQKKLALIDTRRHAVVTAAHPSPLSAKHGFFGSRPFSRINAALQAADAAPVDWTLE